MKKACYSLAIEQEADSLQIQWNIQFLFENDFYLPVIGLSPARTL